MKEELISVFLKTLDKLHNNGTLKIPEYQTHDSIARIFVEDFEKYQLRKEKDNAVETIIHLINKHFPNSFKKLMESVKEENRAE